MSKRPANEMSDRANTEDSTIIPGYWHRMEDLNHSIITLYKADYLPGEDDRGREKLCTFDLANVFNILHVSFQEKWKYDTAYGVDKDLLMNKPLPALPKIELVAAPIDDSQAKVASLKKPRLGSLEMFQAMEKEKEQGNSDFYLIHDSDDEADEEFEAIAKAKKEAEESKKKHFASVEALVVLVEDLESINVKVIGVDMLQNSKKYRLNHAWTVIENIDFDSSVVLYHGTSLAFGQGAVVTEGLAGRKTTRQRFGEGIYLSSSFKIAMDFAKQHRNSDGSLVVLVVRCHLGKIKHVNHNNTN